MNKLHYASEKQVKEYRESDALNYSTLRRIAQGTERYLLFPDYAPKTDSIEIGKLVDYLLTKDPNEDINSIFTITDKTPSSQQKVLIELLKTIDVNDSKAVLDKINVLQWQKNWKDSTRIKKALELYEQWYDKDMSKVISNDTYMQAQQIVQECVYKSKNTLLQSYLIQDLLKNDDRVLQAWYQHPVYSNLYGKNTKALLDILIEYYDKYVIIDIKTTSGTLEEFIKSYKRYRYYLQAQWYKKNLEQQVDKPVEFYFAVLSYVTMDNDTKYSSALFRDINENEEELMKLVKRYDYLAKFDFDYNKYYEANYGNSFVDISDEGVLTIENVFFD